MSSGRLTATSLISRIVITPRARPRRWPGDRPGRTESSDHTSEMTCRTYATRVQLDEHRATFVNRFDVTRASQTLRVFQEARASTGSQ